MTDLEIKKIAEEILVKQALLEKMPKILKSVGRLFGRTSSTDTARRAATSTITTGPATGNRLDDFVQNWASRDKHVPLTVDQIKAAPSHRPMLGLSEKKPVSTTITTPPKKYTPSEGLLSWVDPRVGVGEAASNVAKIRDHMKTDGVFGGIGKYLKNQLSDSQYYTKNGLRYERSALGKVINPAFNSGVGLGVLGAATAEGTNGAPPTLGQRLGAGVTQGAMWGVAPHATGMYYMGRGALDLFKKKKS